MTLAPSQKWKRNSNIFYRFGDIWPEARALNAIFLYSSSLLLSRSRTFVRNDLLNLLEWNWKSDDDDDYNITETIITTETSFVPFGSTTLALTKSENGTRISLTVSEIFDRKHIALTSYFFILLPYYSFSSFRRTGQHSVYFDHVTPPKGEGQSWIFWYQMKDILREKRIYDFGGKIFTRWFPRRETNSPFLSLFMYLLLQEWFNPGNFDILSKLGTARREFLILVGKFQLADFP